MRLMRLIDGEYTVPYTTHCDNGYGIESSADEVTIYIDNGHIDEVIAYGIHFITEQDIDWDPGLTDSECLDLLKEHCPNAFRDYTTEELLDIEAENRLDLSRDE